SAMSNVNSGADSVAAVLGSVIEVRLLASSSPSWFGDAVASNLGVDNIRGITFPGDANLDNVVDTLDFNALAVNFSQSGKTWGNGDFTGEGTVDTLDFNLLAVNFSKMTPTADGFSPVLEPAVAGLASGIF